MIEKKATYIVASYSILDVFDLIAANVKAKAEQEGREIPEGEISCLVLNKVGKDITATIYNGKDGITGTFYKE